MELKPIRNEEEYERMLDWIDGQFDDQPHPDSAGRKHLASGPADYQSV